MNTCVLKEKRNLVQAGFTLMELMIAIMIIGLILGVGIPTAMNYLKRAKVSRAQADVRSLKGAINLYYAHTSRYPQTLRDLIKKPGREAEAEQWQGPYWDKVPKDPWNRKFIYKLTPSGQHPYELFSYGPDGKRGKKQDRISVWKLK